MSPPSSRSTASLARLPPAEHEPHLVGKRGVAIAQRASVDHDVALGPVARAGHLGLAGSGDHGGHRHLVAGEGAGLVGADDRRRSQRLDGGQLLDDGALAGHALDAQRQHDREDGGQALGHRRHRQRHPDEQHVDQVGGAVTSEVTRMAATTTTAMTTTAMASVRPTSSTSRCSGVRSSSVRPSRRATWPISVSMPVAVTTARAPAAGHRGAAEHHVEAVAEGDRRRGAWPRP